MNENIVWHSAIIDKQTRAQQKGHKPLVLWYTGLSGSGKSTIANAVEARLVELGAHTYLLDGDNIRHGLNRGLSFSDEDRVENIRRIGEVSKLFVDAGLIVSTAFISPFRADRALAKSLLQPGEFVEVYVDTPLEVCEKRDPKGLYEKARRGEIANFTGISSAYEAPEMPEIHLQTASQSIEQSVEQVIDYLVTQGVLKA